MLERDEPADISFLDELPQPLWLATIAPAGPLVSE
jgi:hypothetical protein